jgi:hypothetical protein
MQQLFLCPQVPRVHKGLPAPRDRKVLPDLWGSPVLQVLRVRRVRKEWPVRLVLKGFLDQRVPLAPADLRDLQELREFKALQAPRADCLASKSFSRAALL